MAPTAEQARELILAQCRSNGLSVTVADLDRPLDELDFDSLDRLEMAQMLEREFQVKTVKQEIIVLETLNDFVSYFINLHR